MEYVKAFFRKPMTAAVLSYGLVLAPALPLQAQSSPTTSAQATEKPQSATVKPAKSGEKKPAKAKKPSDKSASEAGSAAKSSQTAGAGESATSANNKTPVASGATLKRKGKLSPAAQAQVRQASTGYKECQSSALELMKAKKISPREFKIQMTTCRERFPGAGIYVACKKKVLKELAGKNAEAKAAVGECKKSLVAASFDPESPVPFYVHDAKLYFAGIGLNKSQSTADLAIPNFDCSRIMPKVQDPAQAEHILFGNHPAWFAKLRGKKPDAILKLLKLQPPVPDEGAYVGQFGRVFGDPSTADSAVFFPSASCAFSGDLGKYFSGLSAYYLLDRESNALTPYFGIAFFKPQQQGDPLTTDQLATRMRELLGNDYAIVFQDQSRTIIATDKITKFDEEGDPRDICKMPRKQKLIAIVKARTDGAKDPEFLLVANTFQLCEYGDRVSHRLVP